MRNIRTDLALESHEMYCADNRNTPAPGVLVETQRRGQIEVTRVAVTDENGEQAIGKPRGNYITLSLPPQVHREQGTFESGCSALCDEIVRLLNIGQDDVVLIVGLGNRNITSDSLGPKVLSSILVTRHMFELLPEEIEEGVRSVCALTPGVLGITGIETSEIIRGVVEKVRPDLVIAIDALASRKLERVSTTIQITDTGINPGAGVGNNRVGLNIDTLGVPVLAIGVPLVVDAATLANDTIDLVIDNLIEKSEQGGRFYSMLKELAEEEKYSLIENVLTPTHMGNVVVTPKEVDDIIEEISEMIANGINMALHPGIGIEDLNKYA